jgi:hypothetical protein
MSLTVQQIVTQAGDQNANLAAYGNVPVIVRTSSGKVRTVTGAHFAEGTLVLTTGK